MTLQKKLIGAGLFIVLIPMLLSTGVMWVLIQRQNNHDAIERSAKLLEVIRSELEHQAEGLLTEMRLFSQEAALLNTITYLNQGGNIAKDIEDFYKIELGGTTAKFASMNAYNMVMLFDEEHELISYVHIDETEHVLGLVSQAADDSVALKTITNERVIMGKEEANPEDWVFSSLPEGIPLRYAEPNTEFSYTITVFQGRFVIKTEVSIRSIYDNPASPLLGRLVGYRDLNQNVITRLAELTGVHVNMFLGSQLAVGTLVEFSAIPESALNELEQLPVEAADKLYWHAEHVIADRPYYHVYYPFIREENGAIQGILTLSVSKEPTYQNTREVVFLLSGVSLICVILIIPITLVLSGKIARPIRKMATISEAIAEGAIEQDIEPGASHDEIGSLSRSFHAMVLYLRSMATMAESISYGEIAQEIAPRSERDTLGKAFQRMTVYMQEIAEIATRVADGDLRQEFQPQSEQDILGSAFRKMTDLRHTIGQIIESSTHIRAASGQLQAISELMSADAEKASQKVGRVSSASQQINQVVRHLAAAIEEFSVSIREISRNTSDVAEMANKSVSLTKTASLAITNLEEQSQEIDEITKVITSITGQTHLLALNATIEAARAGESGKGFAVVADEVKTLAQEIASSADNITRKIETIQLSSQKAVTAIKEVSEMIAQTDEIAHAIATSIEQQTSTSNEIVRNIAEVSTGSDETAESIADVSIVNQHISEQAGTVREAAMELAALADQLQQLIEMFKV